MSFSTEFLSLMDSTVKVSTRTTHSNYGEPSFAATTHSFRARVVRRPGYVRGEENEDVSYQDVCWVRSTGASVVNISDRFTVNDVVRNVVAIERYPDEDGIHHTKVMLGY